MKKMYTSVIYELITSMETAFFKVWILTNNVSKVGYWVTYRQQLRVTKRLDTCANPFDKSFIDFIFFSLKFDFAVFFPDSRVTNRHFSACSCKLCQEQFTAEPRVTVADVLVFQFYWFINYCLKKDVSLESGYSFPNSAGTSPAWPNTIIADLQKSKCRCFSSSQTCCTLAQLVNPTTTKKVIFSFFQSRNKGAIASTDIWHCLNWQSVRLPQNFLLMKKSSRSNFSHIWITEQE